LTTLNGIELRRANPEDRESLFKLHEAAFGRADEAKLVLNLIDAETVIDEISLVAVLDGKIVGHILYTDLQIHDDDGNDLTDQPGVELSDFITYAVALAPVAVLPDKQRNGIGKALINESLKLADQRGHGLVIVLGHPEYYPKFGFEPASKFGMNSPFDAPDDVFMAKPLSKYNPAICGDVVYHEAFAEID
jgi:putative acetyltransferase